MRCPRCSEHFGTHERWAEVLLSRQGTGVEEYAFICPECREELAVWTGLREPIPDPPFACEDDRLKL